MNPTIRYNQMLLQKQKQEIENRKLLENMVKVENENTIAEEYLYATQNISCYSHWMVSYGEYKFKDKALGKLVKKVRESFYHDGSQEAKDKFWEAYNELKAYLK